MAAHMLAKDSKPMWGDEDEPTQSDNFGYLMSGFKKKWEDKRIKEFGNQTFKPSIEFEELVERISRLEGQMMSMKFKNINTLG